MQIGAVFAALAYTLWGLFPLFFKRLAAVGPLEVVMHRTVWSLVFVVLVLLVRRRWAWLRAVLKTPKVMGIFALSATLLASNWLVYIWAVNNDHVLDASLGYFILPLMNVALGYVFLHERPRAGQWMAFAVACAGVLWLSWQGGRVPWVALTLAITFALYGLLRKVAPLGALEGLTLETLVLAPAALVAMGWMAWHGQGALVAQDHTSLAWLMLSGPVTALPLLLFAAGARRIPLSMMGVLQYISPSILVLLGVWLYDEPFAGPRVMGFVLIWIALALYTAEGWRHARRAPSLRP
ncbi:EamA family transporter RarD [Candidatus Aalborgicola defluviihabitans]|uniref:EamA family transporter RarD n=1 Tax=Candidatus Aalborgicola defluviihabitans TaxID=3386187 RepID=UPI003909768F|nr:EamA family transporter RarD [Burkholderiales bacterium]